mmetsp:Transcript_9814/g.18837  ORF Transcript_9814/g.18837 Transcript_9814/m.18837 type:complete len:166 (+) Transcript_9814:75-572(+)
MIEEYHGDWGKAMEKMKEIDVVSWEKLKETPNNWYRCQRAFEVYFTEGKPLSSYQRPFGKAMNREQVKEFIQECEYDFRCYFLTTERAKVFRAIDARCDAMVQQGLLKEICSLVKSKDLELIREKDTDRTPAERSIGYRQGLELISNLMQISQTAAPERSHMYLI